MTTNQSLFSQEDLALAEQRIQQGSNRPINKALRFQAALKALIMDVSRLQRIGETKTVLAVDSVGADSTMFLCKSSSTANP